MKFGNYLFAAAISVSTFATLPDALAFTYNGSGHLYIEPGIDYSHLHPSAVPGVTPWSSILQLDLSSTAIVSEVIDTSTPGQKSWFYTIAALGVTQFSAGDYWVYDSIESFWFTVIREDAAPTGVFKFAMTLLGNYIYSGSIPPGAPEGMNVPIINGIGGTEYVDFQGQRFSLFGYVAGVFGEIDSGSSSNEPDLPILFNKLDGGQFTAEGSYVGSYFLKHSEVTNEFLNASFNGRDDIAAGVPDTGSTALLGLIGVLSLFAVSRKR